jgi:FtsP/CotA-like multicopper oxidase with cupredoxin domain
MHPFHMHLVNFVVTRRWKLNANGAFDEMIGSGATPGTIPERPLDFDRKSRHDTVRVQSNEILELLVYFPPGYTGDYVYHCHLVEHEDMGMMLHFNVV